MRSVSWAVAAGVLLAALAGVGWETARHAAAARDEPAAAGPAVAPLTGRPCTVVLRGDASGVAFKDRLPDLGNMVRLSGTLTDADDRWLALKAAQGRQYRIPVASVLAIEYAEAEKK
jgi:hypothetical protein